MVPVMDIATAAGVSVATVPNVLNDPCRPPKRKPLESRDSRGFLLLAGDLPFADSYCFIPAAEAPRVADVDSVPISSVCR